MTNIILAVAMTIWFEAEGEPWDGKYAVGSVIWNRAGGDVSRFEAVISKRTQFSCWNEGAERRTLTNGEAWHQCKQIAEAMVSGTFRPLGAWDHYYNPDLCSPSWADDLVDVVEIGNHVLGRMK